MSRTREAILAVPCIVELTGGNLEILDVHMTTLVDEITCGQRMKLRRHTKGFRYEAGE